VICSLWTEDNCPKYDPGFGGADAQDFVVGRVPPPRDLSRVTSLSDCAAKGARFLQGYRNPLEWSTAALAAANRYLETSPVDAIWATYPFRATLYVAGQLHRSCGIPWVADFRDVFEQWYPRWQWPIERRGEKRVVRSAARIVTVSPGLAGILQRRHGRKVECLPNGFDPADTEAAGVKRDREHFSIVYTGTVSPPGVVSRTSPRSLFLAIDQLANRSLVDVNDIRLMFYGATQSQLTPHLEGCACCGAVHPVPWLPRREVLAVQKGADLLMLLGTELPGVMPAKLFEYLASGRFIMVIPSDNSGIDELLRETGAGTSVSTVEEIAALVLKHYRAWKAGQATDMCVDRDAISRYSRREQAGLLGQWLDEVAT
jgi:hypothetical protein